MKKCLKQLLETLFFFHKFQLQTNLTKNEIFKRVEHFVDENDSKYVGYVEENGFRIVEKCFKSFMFFGHIKNSFAPIAVAKIVEEEGTTTVFCLLRTHMVLQIIFIPIYLSMVLYVFVKPVFLVFLILSHFAFFHPAKRLKKALESLLTEN